VDALAIRRHNSAAVDLHPNANLPRWRAAHASIGAQQPFYAQSFGVTVITC
jgi:hypothetical protein